MNPLFRIDFSISDSLKIVRKSVLIYETIIGIDITFFLFHSNTSLYKTNPTILVSIIASLKADSKAFTK